MLAILVNYCQSTGVFDILPTKFDKKVKYGVIAFFAVVACFMVATVGVLRYLTYSSPNFDFGIWCNMFHNMKESGLPLTTCERDGLLSHFAIHFSPVYYVFLPIYCVFPYAETLQILQTVVLYSGVIPLCFLAKSKKLTDLTAVMLCLLYSLYPAIAAGTFYDLHENCFLVPLLLWCFYFFEEKKYVPMWCFSVAVMLVKEDAFIYILIFAVYVFFQEKQKKTALIMAGIAIAYFLVVSCLMNVYGNGVMTGRYDNLMADKNGGLLEVIKTVIVNPGYLLTQLFVSKDGDNSKILYVFQLLLPLAFMPFVTKKISRYVLAVPILLNIMSMYVYQPNIRFQYSFGITAFLFYVTLLNLSETERKTKSFVLSMSVIATFLMFSLVVVGNCGYYVKRYSNERETYKAMDYVLDEVLPSDASVTCSAFLLPHIADRSEIYEIAYHKENGKYKTDTEFVVLDMRYAVESETQAEYYLKNGYESFYDDGGAIVILKKK